MCERNLRNLEMVTMGMHLLLVLILGTTFLPSTSGEVCLGTNFEFNVAGSPDFTYQTAVRRYTNCTIVDGNLELVWMAGEKDYDFSFLESIEIITGYLLIVAVPTEAIPLTNLKVIRGDQLIGHSQSERRYSVFIALNHQVGGNDTGLSELGFTSLRVIMAGDVYIWNNARLCYADTILWQDILARDVAGALVYSAQQCDECHPSCESSYDGQRHCWGAGPDQCQQLTRLTCAPQCDDWCFGSLPRECCHPECAGGCHGPRNTDCLACQNFENEGQCVAFCPPLSIYDNTEYVMVENPDAKYAEGHQCVAECSPNMVVIRQFCARECPPDMTPIDRVCQPCEGPCPRMCAGGDINDDPLESGYIETFRDCNVVLGNLGIIHIPVNFSYFAAVPAEKMALLENIHTINGALQIEGELPEGIVDLSFLPNLRVIKGQHLTSTGSSVQIYRTNLQSLELGSLELIENGHVLIANNSELCYVDSINWQALAPDNTTVINTYVRHNDPNDTCHESSAVCDDACSEDGCFGEGPRQCVSCVLYEHRPTDAAGKECVTECPTSYYPHESRCLHVLDYLAIRATLEGEPEA